MIKIIDIYLFYYILFGLALSYLAVGIWSARSVRTLKSYFLANQNLGILKLTFALIASQLGSGMILGTAYQAYFIGFWGLLYTIGLSLGFIVLGCGLAARIQNLQIATTAEIFQTYYGSVRLRMIASIISIVSLLGILIAQMVASKALFVGLGILDPYIFLSCWLFIIAYTMLGGLESIIRVDMVQILFIVATFIVTCKWIVPVKIVKYLTPVKLAYIQHRLFKTSIDIYEILPTVFIPLLFSLITQNIGQKFLASKTKATATIASFFAALFLIIVSCIPIYFGIMAKIQGIEISDDTNPCVSLLAKLCPPWLFVIIICAILAAIMSTASSLLCAINSNIVQDFTSYLHFKHKKLWITKSIALLVGLSALIASFFVYGDIIEILEESCRVSVVCLFVPIFIAYFRKSKSALPAWGSIIAGLLVYLLLCFSTLPTTDKDLYALSCSLLGFMGGYLLSKYQKKE
jgi:solute:Na+ symporter, SSS family